MSGSLQIFISYAHEDSELRQELEHHLKILERDSLERDATILLWHDRKIGAGKEWEHEIDKNLEASAIILLLISVNFIASDYCYCIEMQHAMDRHNNGQAHVIPIILRSTIWEKTPFGKLEALPQFGKPVCSEHWRNLDEAFVDIARGIQKVVEGLRTKPGNSNDLYKSLLRLDFRSQGKVFDQFLKDGHRTGAFVIHGEPEYGQDWLLNRFLHHLSTRLAGQASRGHIGKVCRLDFASRVRKKDIETLWRELAVEIGLKNSWKLSLPDALIENAYALLKTQTVIFILRNPVHIGEQYVKQFFETFWSPLTTRYTADMHASSHYCLLFLIDNNNCIDNWLSIGAGVFDQSWKPSTPIKLNKLMKFEDHLLTTWIDYEAEEWTITPSIQDLLLDNDGIPEQVLDRVCTIFDQDWYERGKVWLKY
jgi:inactive STAND/TIR domain